RVSTPAETSRFRRSVRILVAIPSAEPPCSSANVCRPANMMSRITSKLQRSPTSSTVMLIVQPERACTTQHLHYLQYASLSHYSPYTCIPQVPLVAAGDGSRLRVGRTEMAGPGWPNRVGRTKLVEPGWPDKGGRTKLTEQGRPNRAGRTRLAKQS